MRAMSMLADRTFEEVPGGATLLVPLGSTEQHGPHLPLSTDTLIAEHLCHAAAARQPGVVVAPALAYGSSGEHAGFAGTLSIGQAALELVVVELVRSACDTFRRVVLVNGHGGNHAAVERAVTTLVQHESRDVRSWYPAIKGSDAHAGRTETSILLALAPSMVRMDRAEPGNTRPLREIAPLLRSDGLRAITANGVLGDPRDATAEEGTRTLASLVDSLVSALLRFAAET